MTSLADALPPEIAAQVHPDWRTNEAGYRSVRDNLFKSHFGQWICFADGTVVVSCSRPVVVLRDARKTARHP